MSITTDALELAKGFLNAPPATDGWDELLYGETVAPVAPLDPLPPAAPVPDRDEIARAFHALKQSGDAVELRCPKTNKGTALGSYVDANELVNDTYQLSAGTAGTLTNNVYWTLQALKPIECANGFHTFAKKGEGVNDEQVAEYRWLPLDFDPKRQHVAQVVCSTNEEKARAHELALKVRTFLDGFGIPTIFADSGNGYHLLAKISLPVDPANTALMTSLLNGFAGKFGTPDVGIDTAVFNPSRIWKVYGTVSRKGDDTRERPYRVARILDTPALQIVPEEKLRELLSALGVSSTTTFPEKAVYPRNADRKLESNRHNATVQRLGEMHANNEYLDYDSRLQALLTWRDENLVNPDNDSDHNEKKIRAMVKDSFSWKPSGKLILNQQQAPAPEQTPAQPAASTQDAQVVARRMSSYTKKKIDWLWPGRIPFRSLTTLGGDPDQGKSLVSLYVAACVTRGISFHGEETSNEPGEVLLLSAEDDPESTLRPRLEAAGADVDRIILLDSVIVTDGQGKTISERMAQLDTDLQRIMSVLNDNPAIRLIIIDPISSFLGDVPMNREQEVRRVLGPLVKECQKRKLAVILVAHFNKNSETRSAIDRIGGAKALVGLGRAAWVCVREPEQDDDPSQPMAIQDAERRMFLKLKGNLTPSSIGGLLYTIRTKPVEVENDGGGKESVDIPHIVWLGKTDSTAQDVVIDGKKPVNNREAKVEAGVQWLKTFLEKTGGASWSIDAVENGRLHDYSKNTLLHYLARLHGTSHRVGMETQWALPGAQLLPERGKAPEPVLVAKPKRRKPKTVTLEGAEPEVVNAVA